MIARVTHFKFAVARYREVVELVERQINPALADIPGVTGIESTADPETGVGMTVAVFNDRASLENGTAESWQVWRKVDEVLTERPIASIQDVDLISRH